MVELSVQSESRRCVLNAALEAEHTYIIIQAEAHTVKQQYKCALMRYVVLAARAFSCLLLLLLSLQRFILIAPAAACAIVMGLSKRALASNTWGNKKTAESGAC